MNYDFQDYVILSFNGIYANDVYPLFYFDVQSLVNNIIININITKFLTNPMI